MVDSFLATNTLDRGVGIRMILNIRRKLEDYGAFQTTLTARIYQNNRLLMLLYHVMTWVILSALVIVSFALGGLAGVLVTLSVWDKSNPESISNIKLGLFILLLLMPICVAGAFIQIGALRESRKLLSGQC
ncbi:MAG: hypothetical protein AAF591_13770 [Verrucomicrobiota bacterium]